jgi:hypothetical protein
MGVKAPAQTQSPNYCTLTNGIKFIMPPNTSGGLDVLDTHRISLADDFLCTNTGWITAIHLWGSWSNDLVGPISTFYLYIYSDVPSGPTNSYSHPGNLLWQESFAPGQYSSNIFATGSEYFYNPSNNLIGGDQTCWQFCFVPTNPFYQTGGAAAPTVYWIAAYAAGVPNTNAYGWKSSTSSFNDAAVWGGWDNTTLTPVGNWLPMLNPLNNNKLDLSFELLTVPDPQTNGCVEGTQKYVQLPNTNNGFDVRNNQYVLADDFVCTNTGPITDLHLWGSWLNDQPEVNTITFWLAIYSDVPVGQTTYSHPGNLLWSQVFPPGTYSETPAGFGVEQFFDPSQGTFGFDSQLWYYCFNPSNPFTQTGTTASPTRYWLMAYEQLPAGTQQYASGWKTTTNVQNDVSVIAAWPGGFPLANWGTPLVIPGVGPVDLAFKVTTGTTRCPIPVACPVNKSVQCGSSWTFDKPVIGPDQCCTNFTIITNTPVTNGNCPQVITETWTIMDCLGQTTNCSQVVTVLNTNPPNLTCPGNITVTNCNRTNVNWTVSATDACSGLTNGVTVTSVPPSGTFFAPGTTTVTVTAVDACGNSNSCTFTVTVICMNGTPCPETNGVKYVQNPNLNGGLDVWNSQQWVLADDFVCANAGPITDIHIWGSWNYDAPLPGTIKFTLAVYSDVPKSATNSFSHPGTKLWSQVFAPGQYAENIVSNGQENFYNPANFAIIGPDTQVWYYCFYPTNLNQTGTPTAPTTYWLMAYAQLPTTVTNMYGWKTTTNVQHDTSVFAPWPGGPPPSGWGWTPNRLPTGAPFDLAFKLTTPTNPCEISVVCPIDKSVPCGPLGTGWNFDPPVVLADQCCPTLPTPILTSVVISGTCPYVYTATWTIKDCVGTTTYCSQNVTLTNPPPPTVVCPSNIIASTCTSNIQVVWSASAFDCAGLTNGITVVSTPPSGTFFNADTTNTVHVSATDMCGNSNSCTFTVAVIRPPRGILTIGLTSATNITITWTNGAILQVSTNLASTNSWMDIPGANSPFNTNVGMPDAFYRLRCDNP